ncbi:hypothetical protein [Paenibacillus sp. FSL R7-0652]|uniref:hypothetical protein n=1 Tax=Paenibacillus sp. FSL R7-0652 TaxID=2921687 RepID=UPI00315AF6D5
MRGRQTLPGWIGAGRWLSPDFSFSPFQGGNPGINALASLLLPIPSLRWPASLLLPKITVRAGNRGTILESYFYEAFLKVRSRMMSKRPACSMQSLDL